MSAALLGAIIISVAATPYDAGAVQEGGVISASHDKTDTRIQALLEAEISGVTVYDRTHLLGYPTQHVSRSGLAITPERVAEAIALIYREDGYPLAEAGYRVDPNSGKITIQVWEGRLAEVRIVGASGSLSSRIRAYLAPALAEQPLTQATLERGLMLANDLAGGSQTASIDFQPSGQGVLVIHVEQTARSGIAGLEVFPLRPRYASRIYGLEEAYGVLTGGDLARAVVAATHDGADDWSVAGTLSYRAPIGSNGAYIEAFGGNAFARGGGSQNEPHTDGPKLHLPDGAFQTDWHLQAIPEMIALNAGRHQPHQLPTFVTERGVMQCLISGYGRRYWRDEAGNLQSQGVAASLRVASDAIRDVPAYAHHEAGCVLSVRRQVPGTERLN